MISNFSLRQRLHLLLELLYGDRIKNEPKLLIAADKTANLYKLEPSTYNDLLEKNITKSYKKAQPETTQAIHKENKAIATKLRIDDRVDTTADKDAFITLKDLNINVGLYRDDGLAITNATPRNTENIKKEICRIFNSNGLRITIEANKQIINFLDVIFNLNRSTYQPFTKPNTSLQYVHRESIHPPITTKNIPAGINKRLSSLSSDKASFDQAAPPYQKALDESGYHYTLQYEPAKASKRKNRQRNNILWYNPPFSKNTSTNIGHKFLALVDKHFPNDHKLRKIFNRNTIKISYSCMNNTKQIIDNHNKRILTASTQIDNTAAAAATIDNNKTFNCRQKNTCPLDEKLPAIISNLSSHRHTQRQQHNRNIHRTHRE